MGGLGGMGGGIAALHLPCPAGRLAVQPSPDPPPPGRHRTTTGRPASPPPAHRRIAIASLRPPTASARGQRPPAA
jgi:hypothetical protein